MISCDRLEQQRPRLVAAAAMAALHSLDSRIRHSTSPSARTAGLLATAASGRVPLQHRAVDCARSTS